MQALRVPNANDLPALVVFTGLGQQPRIRSFEDR
jgi:hypothetical protein